MKKEYLPSKQFINGVFTLAIIFGIGFIIYKVSPEIKARFTQNRGLRGMSVKDLVENDTNKNGIQDWEESLFGLDPNKNGEENKKIIEEKRKSLNIGEDFINDENLSQSDKLSRELFTVIATLEQTGNLNETAIENITATLTEKLESEPIVDIYTKKIVTTKPTNQNTLEVYYNSFGNIALKYKNAEIGDELIYLSQALINQDEKAMQIVVDISDKYEEFGKDLIDMAIVPSSLSDTHLSLANNYHKTSLAIKRMSLMLKDPLYGMNATADYKNFNDGIITNLGEISDFLEKNVIIKP